MAVSEEEIRQAVAAKENPGPRITPELVDAKIKDAWYHGFPGTTLTVCVLLLENGWVVCGHSAAASPENFDAELGRKLAFEHARNQIWALEGYLLREKIHQQG